MNYSVEGGRLTQHSSNTLIGARSTTKQAETSSSSDSTPTTLSNSVDISSEARQALIDDQIAKKVDNFISKNGESLYAILLERPKVPENLATKLDDQTIPPEERSKIQEQLNQREMTAFLKYAKQSPPDTKMYFEKYAEYLDSLSFEEKQSSRYKGQRADIIPQYERVVRAQGETPKDLSLPEDSTLRLFELIRREGFKIENMAALEDRFRSIVDSDNQATIDNLIFRVRSIQEALEHSRSGDESELYRLESVVDGLISADGFFPCERDSGELHAEIP